MTTHHFSSTVVWSRLGPFISTAGNLRSRSVTLPAGGAATVVQSGVTQVGFLDADSDGAVTFTTTDIPVVIVDFGAGPMRLISDEAASTGGGGGGAGTVTSVNSQVPDGTGNVVIHAADLSLSSVATSGDYNALVNLPPVLDVEQAADGTWGIRPNTTRRCRFNGYPGNTTPPPTSGTFTGGTAAMVPSWDYYIQNPS